MYCENARKHHKIVVFTIRTRAAAATDATAAVAARRLADWPSGLPVPLPVATIAAVFCLTRHGAISAADWMQLTS